MPDSGRGRDVAPAAIALALAVHDAQQALQPILAAQPVPNKLTTSAALRKPCRFPIALRTGPAG